MQGPLQVCCLFIIQIPGCISEHSLPTTAAHSRDKLAETQDELIAQTKLIKYSISIRSNTDDRMSGLDCGVLCRGGSQNGLCNLVRRKMFHIAALTNLGSLYGCGHRGINLHVIFVTATSEFASGGLQCDMLGLTTRADAWSNIGLCRAMNASSVNACWRQEQRRIQCNGQRVSYKVLTSRICPKTKLTRRRDRANVFNVA